MCLGTRRRTPISWASISATDVSAQVEEACTPCGRIVLEAWQREIVDAHPWEFVRGLVHSDGCRVINGTTRVIGGERKPYEYPRYFFTNLSDDIVHLFTRSLELVGVEWKQANVRNISVARKASVALMDVHVGPKC